ncbi:MAG: GNAT family N-acetyltransferase [Clostridiales bacterium]|nr:GNAT family N-acetyltransferase [Clostridiales bacterium]
MEKLNFNIEKLKSCDKEDFMTMSREFYTSPAVLHNIDYVYHERAFDEIMRSDTYLDCYMFKYNNTNIGYALLIKGYSREAGGITVWVDELYVRHEFQGHGIGSTFFKWLEANVPAARYRLEVEPENVGAMRLYERMGYDKLQYLQMVKE